MRIVLTQGWYIGITSCFPPKKNLLKALFNLVCYSLGIYLLNLFLAFLQPKFDPSLTQDEGLEDGEGSLPTKQDEEFRPFIRRLPEFKFWHSATRAIAISFVCTWFSVFNVPVFWPVLVVYFIILFSLTSKWPFLLFARLYFVLLCSTRLLAVIKRDFPIEAREHFIHYLTACSSLVRRQIQHMIKYRYVPFTFGKTKYNQRSGH